MFTIYALRIRGQTEVRYIGQTQDLERRFAGHFSTANNMPWATSFAMWLKSNADEIEAVALATAETREDARRIERDTINVFLALEHRLFNQWLVPAEKRCAPRLRRAA